MTAECRGNKILSQFDWLAKSLPVTDLGRLIIPHKRFSMSPPFFFNIFAAEEEGLLAMQIRVGDLNQPRGICSVVRRVDGISKLRWRLMGLIKPRFSIRFLTLLG